MSEDLKKTVQKLIDLGKGDSDRLHEIFSVLKLGTPLYMSDYKYVESLIKTLEEQEQKSETEIKSKKKKDQNKKSEKDKEPEKVQPKDEYALKILKNRLASGEITIEEFQELKKVLKEAK